MSDEEQIQTALDALYVMSRLVEKIEDDVEVEEADRTIRESERKIKAAVRMIGKNISGDKLQAVLDGDSVTLLPVVKEASAVVNEVSQ